MYMVNYISSIPIGLFIWQPIFILIIYDLDRNSNKFGLGHPGIIIKTTNTTKTVKLDITLTKYLRLVF